MVELINWHWLEELLVGACETEISSFAARQPNLRLFGSCLEFDGLRGELSLGYGERASVERVAAGHRRRWGVCYPRNVEVGMERWRLRACRFPDSNGDWARALRILEAYRRALSDHPELSALEFLVLRFEYLAECVVRRLIDRGAFRSLRREDQFIAFPATWYESLDSREERLAQLYPSYRRAVVHWDPPQPGGPEAPGTCGTPGCARRARLSRCTACQEWYCASCQKLHLHPEFQDWLPFFDETDLFHQRSI